MFAIFIAVLWYTVHIRYIFYKVSKCRKMYKNRKYTCFINYSLTFLTRLVQLRYVLLSNHTASFWLLGIKIEKFMRYSHQFLSKSQNHLLQTEVTINSRHQKAIKFFFCQKTHVAVSKIDCTTCQLQQKKNSISIISLTLRAKNETKYY